MRKARPIRRKRKPHSAPSAPYIMALHPCCDELYRSPITLIASTVKGLGFSEPLNITPSVYMNWDGETGQEVKHCPFCGAKLEVRLV